MEYTTLGATGTTVSRICLGTWRFGERSDGVVETTREEAHELLDAAADRGINFIDTANRYGDPPGTSEEYVGDWLTEHDRKNFVIATKVGMRAREGVNGVGLSRRHIREQIEASLERLNTDYIDLYYIHRLDNVTPVKETLSTLSALVEEGTVHHLGASTMAAWQLTKLNVTAREHGWAGIDVTQPPVDATLNNWKRYDGFDLHRYLEVCTDQNLGVCPYSPLAGGFLTGKYERTGDDLTDISGPAEARGSLLPEDFERKYLSESAWRVLEAVEEIAIETDATPAQVALQWLIRQEDILGGMVPIVGARTPNQIIENARATELELTDAQRERIDEARGERLTIDG